MTDLDRLLEAEAKLTPVLEGLRIFIGDPELQEASDTVRKHLRPALERAQRIEEAARAWAASGMSDTHSSYEPAMCDPSCPGCRLKVALEGGGPDV